MSSPFRCNMADSMCPKPDGLTMNNLMFQFALKRRLGLAICGDGPDVHGHAILAARWATMTVMIAAWRRVFIEADGKAPDRNREGMLRDTRVPVPVADARRMDLVVAALTVKRGLPCSAIQRS